MTKLWASVAYTMKFVPKRSKRAVEETIRGEFPVEIRDISSADAPLVLRTAGNFFSTSDIRCFEGRLLERPRSANGLFGRERFAEAIAGAGVDEPYWTTNPFNEHTWAAPGRIPFQPIMTFPDRNAFDFGRVGTMIEDGAEAAGSRAQEMADRVAFIDGEPWIQRAEPVLTVGRPDRGGKISVSTDISVACGTPQYDRDTCAFSFRADQKDRTREFVRRMCTNVQVFDAVEVLDASVLTFDPRTGFTRALFDSFIDQEVDAAGFHRLPLPVMELWVRLRRLAVAWTPGTTDGLTEGVAILRELVDVLPNRTEANKLNAIAACRDIGGLAKLMLARWDFDLALDAELEPDDVGAIAKM